MERKKQTEKTTAEKKASKQTQAQKNKEAAPNPRVEALEDIKMRGLYLHGYAITMDTAPIVFDTEEYRRLVGQFYEENSDFITPVIYRACLENYEFFMTMVEKALNHFRAGQED